MTSLDRAEEDAERIVEARLPMRPGYEKVAMDFASSHAWRMGLGPDQIEALRTAISEAVIKAIEYGNNQDYGMKVRVKVTDDGSYSIDVCSLGQPYQGRLIIQMPLG